MKKMLVFFLLVYCTSCVNPNDNSNQALPEETKATIANEQEQEVIDPDFVMGKFDPATHDDFTIIDSAYSNQAGRYMQKEAFESFKRMYADAKAEGIDLLIVSAARNFDYQKGIWERKWNGQTKVRGDDLSQTIPDFKTRALKILEYSSMPGTSRHHWGTDIDLNKFENDWFETGEGLLLFEWLEKNAANYGYCRPYTAKDDKRPHGYNEEKWHWSYIPLAKLYTQFASENLENSIIEGFAGADVAREIGVIEKYILGINKECK